MSRRTWKSPNHLLRPSISMILSPPGGASARTTVPVVAWVMWVLSSGAGRRYRGSRSPYSHPQLPLELPGGDAHPVGEEEVDHRDEQEHFELRAPRHEQRLRLDRDEVGDPAEVDEPDDEHERGVLEEADRLADDGGDHGAQRLGQHDQHRRLPGREA